MKSVIGKDHKKPKPLWNQSSVQTSPPPISHSRLSDLSSQVITTSHFSQVRALLVTILPPEFI